MRAGHEPYDKDRLIELVTEPVDERLADRSAKDAPDRSPDARDALAQSREPELTPDATPSPELIEQRLAEREADTGRGATHSDAAADTGEAVAGGIGKIAELAAEKALDRARDEAEALRQPQREKEDAERRYAHHEQQRSATDTFDSFFNENAERLRREEEERRQKRNDRDRER